MFKLIAVLTFAASLAYLGAGAQSNAANAINAHNAALEQALQAAQ